jgi:DNA-binding NtrC family response regulator
VVAATNKSLAALVDAGLFRSDLYYRLAGLDVHVPPLRERCEDIIELAAYFLERHRSARDVELSRAAGDALLTYDWPGKENLLPAACPKRHRMRVMFPGAAYALIMFLGDIAMCILVFIS